MQDKDQFELKRAQLLRSLSQTSEAIGCIAVLLNPEGDFETVAYGQDEFSMSLVQILFEELIRPVLLDISEEQFDQFCNEALLRALSMNKSPADA